MIARSDEFAIATGAIRQGSAGKGLELFSSLDQLNEFLQLYMTGYDVKEFITMQYNDTDNISPSLVKSASQTKLEGTNV